VKPSSHRAGDRPASSPRSRAVAVRRLFDCSRCRDWPLVSAQKRDSPGESRNFLWLWRWLPLLAGYELVVALPQQAPWILFGEQMLEAFLSHKLPEASVRATTRASFAIPVRLSSNQHLHAPGDWRSFRWPARGGSTRPERGLLAAFPDRPKRWLDGSTGKEGCQF